MKVKLNSERLVLKGGNMWIVKFKINNNFKFAKVIKDYSNVFSQLDKKDVEETYKGKTFEVWDYQGKLYCKPSYHGDS